MPGRRRGTRAPLLVPVLVLAGIAGGCYTVPNLSRWEAPDPTAGESGGSAGDSAPPPVETRLHGWPEGYYSGRFVVTYGFGTRSRTLEEGAVHFLFRDGRYRTRAQAPYLPLEDSGTYEVVGPHLALTSDASGYTEWWRWSRSFFDDWGWGRRKLRLTQLDEGRRLHRELILYRPVTEIR